MGSVSRGSPRHLVSQPTAWAPLHPKQRSTAPHTTPPPPSEHPRRWALQDPLGANRKC